MTSQSPVAERILGIDPGSRLTGFGIIDVTGQQTVYIASGAVNCSHGTLPERLLLIFQSISEIVAQYQPHTVVVESVFMHRNAGSALKLGQARAAAMCATFSVDAKVHEYAPREIKQAVVGNGGASKEQVQHMVSSLLALDGDPSADAADALAAALCHAQHQRMKQRLAGIAAVAGER
ncbi:MAG: crossover junction endodeoxyribonuclease RuvC [Woeseia sp.]|nr:crossover junction endodeoxyribonuclease RuvC [Woeseia sp.]MBT8096235.1 crossover junction endodeoxyribonuclease RuvC [Woeseia sp.]NNE60602.1 crossover junction endodeoxyribonuclease RuvC [Woeseia sp.]NNL54400.1 crossover junction endodeoxyribonuclease RuvC [Woeseia sp.]